MFRAVIIDFIDGFLIFACILNFLIGLILLLKPDLIKSLNQMLSKWISTRKLTKPIGKGLDFQNLLLKYNTIFGWLLLIGFSICIYVYFHNVRIGMINQFIISNKWGPLLEILIITLNWVLILFLSIGIILMVLLIFKPETVQKLTILSDKWISTRAMTKPLEVLYFNFDEFVLSHHTIFGMIMILFSLIILYLLF